MNMELRRRGMTGDKSEHGYVPVGTNVLADFPWIANTGMDTTTGETKYYSGSNVTDFIPINTSYTYQKNNKRISFSCFYDAAKNYIGYTQQYNTNVENLNIKQGAFYMRVQVVNAQKALEITRTA